MKLGELVGPPSPYGTRVVNKYMEEYDVDIQRPGKWGNPFSHRPGTTAKYRTGSKAESIAKHRAWLPKQAHLMTCIAQELRGKRLGCTCAPDACHGDTLREFADIDAGS